MGVEIVTLGTNPEGRKEDREFDRQILRKIARRVFQPDAAFWQRSEI